MSVITCDGGPLSKEQKDQLIKEFTDAAVKASNIPAPAFVVLLKESSPDNIGVGGKALSTK